MVRRISAVAWVLALAMAASCGDEPRLETPDREVCLDRRDGLRYCIDVYEASRKDATSASEGADESAPRSFEERLPWVEVTWAAAREACRSRGRRLCERDEWVDACDGQVGEDSGTVYTYGDVRDEAVCNTDGAGPSPTGDRQACRSPAGTFDQSGNVWEWTGNLTGAVAARGGGWRSTQTHGCKDALMGVAPESATREIGFRCCRDL